MDLAVESLDQHYGSAQVLRNVGFAVPQGSCVAVLGRNGAGKSTLLRCLMGVLAPTSGSVRWGGEEITGLPSHLRSRKGIAYVPQGREIFGELSVGENIQAAARAHGTLKDGSIDEAVTLFPVLKEMWRRPGGQLSGGQQQQLAFARALVTRPKLLILDEPTEGIQPSIVQLIEDTIASLKGRMSILLVEQYLDFAVSLADHFVVLSRGAVVEHGARGVVTREQLSRHIAV
ncbi:LIV-I protein F [Hartmannibacter diazotrophicus]|uniref:LIV-I protein F n=1 Tax=Hartmannibacter diazotrophicus TaxID=1482074 RepID=A0A2C9D690_9HYPH|nr:LIV-I protein F [Hartmannibacter diazotrophicus]